MVSSLPQHQHKIGLRPSMKKIEPSQRWRTDQEAVLDIVSTDVDAHLRANVDLLQMLEANGVGKQCLQEILDGELRDIGTITSGEDNDEVRRIAANFLSKSGEIDLPKPKIGQNMIKMGYSLSEPHLRHILDEQCKSSLQSLRKMKIPLRDGQYLWGIPDPTTPPSLEEGQIYVRSSILHHSLPHDEDVIVSRHPMGHPGDLQKLRHVDNKSVRKFLGNRRNVVVFSVKGSRPAAGMMSGGDYDGDTFIVLWNPKIVGSMESTVPQAILPQNIGPSNKANQVSTLGYRVQDLIVARLKSRRKITMQSAAILRQLYADRYGAADSRSLEVGRIYTDAIDAEKTGSQVQLPDKHFKYLNSSPKPHWWWKHPTPKFSRYQSTSLVGKLYDRIEEHTVKCAPKSTAPIYDADLLVDGRETYRKEATNIFRLWREKWAAFGSQDKGERDESKKQRGYAYKLEVLRGLRDIFDSRVKGERLLMASALYEEAKRKSNCILCFLLCDKELNEIKHDAKVRRGAESG